MTAKKLSPAEIRRAREDNPKLRERDLALQYGFSEADLVAAHCGRGTRRIRTDVNEILVRLEALGEVMALTRNDSAVHEKIGVYDKIVTGRHSAMALGADIDLRIFPTVWRHAFAVEKQDGDALRRSLQFFDTSGEAVHKVHLRPASDVAAYEALVQDFLHGDQSDSVATVAPVTELPLREGPPASAEDLRERWSRMTDVHQFFGMLRELKLTRQEAVRMIGFDFAWPVDREAVEVMMRQSVNEAIPVMCFVGNRGCIQIHSGPIREIKPMGPWLNVTDPGFHLHLRTDHIREVWAVRKPTRDGHVTSIEAYDGNGSMIIQFFGKRHEGQVERDDWRMIAENLPRLAQPTAA